MPGKSPTVKVIGVIVPKDLSNLLIPTHTIKEDYRLISVHSDGKYYPRSVITDPATLDRTNNTYPYVHLIKDAPFQKILAVLRLTDNLYTALVPYLENNDDDETTHSPNQTNEHT